MIESQELTDYIKATIQAVDKATAEAASPNYKNAPLKLKFNLAVVNTKGAGGGFRLLVVNAEGKYTKEEISKIEFEYDRSTARGYFVVGHSR